MQRIIEKLRNNHSFPLRAEGFSMHPTIHSSDVVYLKKVNFKEVKTNDIVLVRKGKKAFIHRVIYITKNYLITRGDNNSLSDGKVNPKQIIGRVYQIKRDGQIINPQYINLLQSTLYFQEIVKVKNAFEIQNINFVFLKGLPVHLKYEKKYPTRIYADCDLLVNKTDYIGCEKIFAGLGYQKAKTEFTALHKILKDKPTEFSFYKEINKFPVVFDIHLEPVFLMNQLGKLAHLYPQRLIDKLTEDMLNTKRKIVINNESFLILNSEFLILYLALHFFHHNYQGIYRLELLDKIIRSSIKIPSPRRSPFGSPSEVFLPLSNKILDYRVKNFVYPVFLMLRKYYDTPIPIGFLKLIKPKEDKLKYIKKNIMTVNVFDDETRLKAGVERFKKLFYLSANPLPIKLLIFINPQVIYSIIWVIYRRLLSFFSITLRLTHQYHQKPVRV